MGLKEKAVGVAVREGIRYLRKDFDTNSIKLIEFAEKKVADNPLYTKILVGLKERLRREGNVWTGYIKKLICETDEDVLNSLVGPALNAFIRSYDKRVESMKKYDCNIPWAILIDPTAACNLKCTGCWAAEYGKTSQLSYADLTKIITEGKELGTYVYLYTGGEPLMRKKDLIRLCEEHSDCLFITFTNGI